MKKPDVNNLLALSHYPHPRQGIRRQTDRQATDTCQLMAFEQADITYQALGIPAMNTVFLSVVITDQREVKGQMTEPVWYLAQLSWRRGHERGGGMIFPLLEAAKGMLYRLDWQGFPFSIRGTIKSTLAVEDITCVLNKRHRTKQNSRARSALQQIHASSGKFLHAMQSILNKRASGLCTLGFLEASSVMSSSQKQNLVSKSSQSAIATSTIAMLGLFLKNLT